MKQLFWAAAASLLAATAFAAATPEQKCQGGKNETAGKFSACVAKAEKKLIATSDATAYAEALAKCATKFNSKWYKLEQAAASAEATCPTTADETSIRDFVNACNSAIAEALAGNPLIDDPLTCDSNVSACHSNYATCSTSLATCSANYATCSTGLGTCHAGDASAANVRAGKTFSSGAGLGITGTMPDQGAVHVTPTTSAQSIAEGYHDGTGSVAGDADLNAGNIKSGVEIFGITGTSPLGFPRSGQTTSYGAGSDGDVQAGEHSYTDNGDGTITDNVTGLMWEKKDDSGGIHDKDNTYTWGMTSPPFTMNGTMVSTFLATLNAGSGFAGHTDWRIPNVKELQSILHYGQVDPAIAPIFNNGCVASCSSLTCSCTRSWLHWTSTTYNAYVGFGSDIADAYAVIFVDGGVTTGNSALAGGCKKGCGLYVRAVRSVQ
ncbi:MAG TPA: DUF1566 domain-containing protein [Terriglobales bacterium]|nr:DUF1566 domain-containing protein [Terriglobales bacterium]